MESSPTTDLPQPKAKGRSKRRRAFLVIVALLLLGLLAWAFWPPAREPQFVWLTPAELARLDRPGPFAPIKFQILRLARRLGWRSRGPNIRVGANVLEMPIEAAQRLELGAPLSTNADGMRVWILTPEVFKECNQRLHSMRGVNFLFSPTVLTADDMTANLSTGPFTTGQHSGLDIGLTPRVVRDSLRLRMSVLLTAPAAAAVDSVSIKTNLASQFQAFVPDTHSIVLDAGNGQWLIATPTLVDDKGNPIKR